MNNNFQVFSDGGARGNPGPAAIGVVIKTENGKIVGQISKLIGVTTNNEAEYKGLITALEFLSQKKEQLGLSPTTEIKFFLDSNLIVNQVNGLYKVKNSRLREFLYKVREMEQSIPAIIIYTLIPREKNYEADLLVNQALDKLANLSYVPEKN